MKFQNPNPKSQISSKFQISNLRGDRARFWSLRVWNLFGLWILDVGISSGGIR
jgi:hypothetical protein